MEEVPSEIIETNILLRITPEELPHYCATNRRYAKLCRQKRFWQLRVARTPRRVLQDDWFLYFAQQGEISLLWPLINEMARQGVIIDNWAITYAALYLLEQEDKLSPDGRELLKLLLADAKKDRALRSLIRPFDLQCYFYAIQESVVTFREQLAKSTHPDKGLPIYDHPVKDWEAPDYMLYLGEFENGYLYDHVKDVLPPLRTYWKDISRTEDKTHKYTIADFIIPLVAVEAADGKMDEMKDLLSYINEYVDEDYIAEYCIKKVTDSIIRELPYVEAMLLIPWDKRWISLLSRHTLPFPLDPTTYYYLASQGEYKSSNLARLSWAVRAIEPEEFISYLHQLTTDGKITSSEMNKVTSYASKRASRIGYTYFAAVVEDELKVVEETN